MKQVISIPDSELVIPDDASMPNLSEIDIYRLLAPKVVRGRIICLVLVGAIAIGLVASNAVFRDIPWTVAGGLAECIFLFGFFRAGQKLAIARRISQEPDLVYWAHPKVLRQQTAGGTIDITFITLHTRYGDAFEVGMSREEMLLIIGWLKQHNPDVRLGAYDGK